MLVKVMKGRSVRLEWQKETPLFDPARHHRRSIRLRGVGYDEAGGYCLTICTRGRECLFGEVVEGEMVLNDLGRIVAESWDEIPVHFPHAAADAFVVMPNHVHGIIGIMHEAKGRATRSTCRGLACQTPTRRMYAMPERGTIPTIAGAFKSAVTRRVNALRGTPGALVWQRNYYEQIIRGERHLNAVREYIRLNAARWGEDAYAGSLQP